MNQKCNFLLIIICISLKKKLMTIFNHNTILTVTITNYNRQYNDEIPFVHLFGLTISLARLLSSLK